MIVAESFFFLISITKYLFTILTYKQYMVLTLLTKIYSTYKTILTDLQCEILTLLTILSSTYNTIYIRYKNQKKRGEYDKFLLVNCTSNSKEKKEIKD